MAQCILVHILVTLVLLLTLAAIYAGHVLVVPHRGMDVIRISLRSSPTELSDEEPGEISDGSSLSSVGGVYINVRPVVVACSCVLLRARWSLAPAHCVTVRAEPDHAALLAHWKIRYKDQQDTDIKRGIVHSFFNKDDFANNIGIFEHLDRIIDLPTFKFSNKKASALLTTNQDFEIFGWNKLDGTFYNKARVLRSEKCAEFVVPLIEAQRKSEICIIQYGYETRTDEDVYGAAVIFQSEIVGLFSWGDRSGEVPQVVLLIAPYKAWIENMISVQ